MNRDLTRRPAPGLQAVLTDIEGTTTPIAFVHRVLFPYARAALPALLAVRRHEPEVAAAIEAIATLAPGADPLSQCLAWMDEDAKITPLKALQGIAWQDGYETGALRAEFYADVAPALRAWHEAGLRLGVYSSGSETAQRLIFGHAEAAAGGGSDLTPLFSVFLDTRIGAKRDKAAYRRAAEALELQEVNILFLSDVEAELDAAAAAGLLTCQLVRAADATVASHRHPAEPDFDAVAARFGLPRAPSCMQRT